MGGKANTFMACPSEFIEGLSFEGVIDMYREPCPREWYLQAKEIGAYKDLTLEGWAREIEWRMHYKSIIANGVKGEMEGVWSMFLDQLNLGIKRTSPALDIASKPSKPVTWVDNINDYYSNRHKENRETLNTYGTNMGEEGLTSQFIVNISYDDKTLMEQLKIHLRLCRKKHTPYNKEFSGKRALTEDDAETWNKQCVLQYIDFKFCSDMTGCKFTEDEVSVFLELPETTLRQTTREKAEDILNVYVLGQIRTSIKLNRGISHK